jgi:hypothetical protein
MSYVHHEDVECFDIHGGPDESDHRSMEEID